MFVVVVLFFLLRLWVCVRCVCSRNSRAGKGSEAEWLAAISENDYAYLHSMATLFVRRKELRTLTGEICFVGNHLASYPGRGPHTLLNQSRALYPRS